jgi:DNA-binding NarL/FixJ family response regulator
MDIHMPGVNGLEATRQITNALPATRVVMLTISEEDKDLFEAIKCGAHGYLSKKVEPEKLRELIEGVFRGEAPLSGATAARILREFAAKTAKDSETTPVDDLTAREKEVLQFLAAGLTNKEIGVRLNIAENTVKNHLKNILAKLHLQNRVQAATLAIQQGMLPMKALSNSNPINLNHQSYVALKGQETLARYFTIVGSRSLSAMLRFEYVLRTRQCLPPIPG